MKIRILIVCASLLLCLMVSGQDKVARVPVGSAFWGTHLADRQTTTTVKKGELQLEILHRFGTIENGFSDLLGVYGSSNISMGVSYGITKRLDARFFTQKFHKAQEIGLKYRLLKQSTNNEMPVSLSFYSALSVDGRDKTKFGDEYSPGERLYFQNELIAGRQFNYKWNIQASFALVHMNSVENNQQADKYDINLATGFKVSHNKSVFASYQHAGNLTWFDNNELADFEPEPAITIGFESFTRTHNFQLFLTTRDKVSLGKDLAYNHNSISFKNLRIGFNIRVKLISPGKQKGKKLS